MDKIAQEQFDKVQEQLCKQSGELIHAGRTFEAMQLVAQATALMMQLEIVDQLREVNRNLDRLNEWERANWNQKN